MGLKGRFLITEDWLQGCALLPGVYFKVLFYVLHSPFWCIVGRQFILVPLPTQPCRLSGMLLKRRCKNSNLFSMNSLQLHKLSASVNIKANFCVIVVINASRIYSCWTCVNGTRSNLPVTRSCARRAVSRSWRPTVLNVSAECCPRKKLVFWKS